MASISKNHYLLLSTVIFFIVSSYLLKVTLMLIEKDNFEGEQPINYNILETENNNFNSSESTRKFDSDYISISDEMVEILKEHNFTIENFINGLTKKLVIFSALPDDFMKLEPIEFRKNIFIKTILPIVYVENKNILTQRKRILEWWTETEGEFVSREYWPDWLIGLSNEYDYKEENVGDLLMRVDIIPISMALSQAVVESGWGTSRYSREANAMFGQYTFDKSSGILPENRDPDKKHLIKKFNSISESVRSYIKNINTHLAYEELRKKRRELRMDGEKINGMGLIPYLTKYSERGKSYTADLTSLLEENDFGKLDILTSSVSFVE